MSFSKRIYFNIALLLVASVFLFLIIGSDFLHNHDDANFHEDCPACQWLVVSVFTFSIALILLGLILRPEIFLSYTPQIFISKIYLTFLHLRGPPALA